MIQVFRLLCAVQIQHTCSWIHVICLRNAPLCTELMEGMPQDRISQRYKEKRPANSCWRFYKIFVSIKSTEPNISKEQVAFWEDNSSSVIQEIPPVFQLYGTIKWMHIIIKSRFFISLRIKWIHYAFFSRISWDFSLFRIVQTGIRPQRAACATGIQVL